MGGQQPSPGRAPGRDPRLGLFASGGRLDHACPSGLMLGTLESLAAPSEPDNARFAGSTHDENAGMLAAAQATESHAAWLKMTLIRDNIRRHAPAVPGAIPRPETWDEDLSHDLAAILRVSWQAAVPIAHFAWELEARLPGVDELLRRGILSYFTAKIVAEEFSVLDDDQVRQAETMLLGHDLGDDTMTPGAIRRLCQHIAVTVDPQGAARRREKKERDEARLKFFVDHGGTMGMFASGLPADQALRADRNVQKRALEYKAAGITEKMDVLRVQALLDLANGVTVDQRYAQWRAEHDDAPFPDTEPEDLDDRFPPDDVIPDQPPDGTGDDGGPAGDEDGPDEDGPDDGDPGSGDEDEDGPDDRGPGPWGDSGPDPGGGNGPRDGGPGTGPVSAGRPDPGLPALIHFTFPLPSILGQAERPGEAPGFGSVDPELSRRLAAAGAQSPRSRFCVTFTDDDGHAVAHGCAKLIRAKGTMPADRTRDGPSITDWDFTRDTTRPGPEGGYGAWVLRLPTGAPYRVDLHKIPVHECDHAYATDAYQPTDLLRHLVEVRDGECTFVGCSHPARNCDFEHTVPWHEGGTTDGCNGAARSRRCHRVKQSHRWRVTQPAPGWHRWQAPSGRSYTKGPRRYPT